MAEESAVGSEKSTTTAPGRGSLVRASGPSDQPDSTLRARDTRAVTCVRGVCGVVELERELYLSILFIDSYILRELHKDSAELLIPAALDVEFKVIFGVLQCEDPTELLPIAGFCGVDVEFLWSSERPLAVCRSSTRLRALVFSPRTT